MSAREEAAEPAEDEQAAEQSWDAFWAEVEAEERQATETILGVVVPVPTDITLRFSQRVAAVQDSESDEDVAALIADLFGEDVYAQWVAAGMTTRQFRTVLMWGIARGRGQEMTFREAYDLMRGAEDGQGKPLPAGNRAERRAAQRSRSAAGGGRSKPTSSGSTTSARKKSRA